MAFFPVALTAPQYFDGNGDPASGFVLKAYQAGTSTNVAMATDSTGNTTATSIALNATGYPEVSGTIVIPHLEQDYKLSLYPTQAAADSDSGATWTIDNLSNTLFFNIGQLSNVSGTDTITAVSSPTIGSYAVDDLFIFTPAGTNTGAVTLNIDSQGAGAVQWNGKALTGGEISSTPILVQVATATPVFEIVAGAVHAPLAVDIASTSALPVNAAGNIFDVTGTSTITSLVSKGPGASVVLHFDGVLTLTHHATDLILPGGGDIVTSAGDIGVFYEYATGDWRCISYERAQQQPVIQIVNTSTGAVATGTTVLPFDDTIPQNTEGDEYMTLSITPKSASNILIIEANVNLSHGVGGAGTIALFQDSTANALSAASFRWTTTDVMESNTLKHYMVAGTTSSTTFKIRAGSSSAGTVTFNGQSGSRVLGGVGLSGITITEYAA